MPNQRAKNKVRFGGFVSRELKVQIVRRAKAGGWGKNIFGFAMMVAGEEMDRLDRKRKRRGGG